MLRITETSDVTRLSEILDNTLVIRRPHPLATNKRELYTKVSEYALVTFVEALDTYDKFTNKLPVCLRSQTLEEMFICMGGDFHVR